jgi:hypothetical protein
MKPRHILDTALSSDGQFYTTDDLTGEARECIDAIKAQVARLSLNTTVRGEPMIDKLADDEHHILDELDGLLAELRSRAEAWFDDLRDQIMYSTEWWVFMGTPLFSCDADAPMVIELQDLKYQVPEHFEEEVFQLRRMRTARAILLFGNDATDEDLAEVDFAYFDGLELLNLAQNRLRELPAGVAQHPTLRHLGLRQTDVRLDAEQARSWDTPNIEHLDLTDCAASPEFLDAMDDKYPQANIVV